MQVEDDRAEFDNASLLLSTCHLDEIDAVSLVRSGCRDRVRFVLLLTRTRLSMQSLPAHGRPHVPLLSIP